MLLSMKRRRPDESGGRPPLAGRGPAPVAAVEDGADALVSILKRTRIEQQPGELRLQSGELTRQRPANGSLSSAMSSVVQPPA